MDNSEFNKHFITLMQNIAGHTDANKKQLDALNALMQEYQQLQAEHLSLLNSIQNLELDNVVLEAVGKGVEDTNASHSADLKSTENCFRYTTELYEMIKKLDVPKISFYHALVKQMELQEDWRIKEDLYKRNYEQNQIMENRHIVQELRQVQMEQKRLKKEAEKIEQQAKYDAIKWRQKIEDAYQERNTTIVELVKLSVAVKKLEEEEEERKAQPSKYIRLTRPNGFEESNIKKRGIAAFSFPKLENFVKQYDLKNATNQANQTLKTQAVNKQVQVEKQSATNLFGQLMTKVENAVNDTAAAAETKTELATAIPKLKDHVEFHINIDTDIEMDTDDTSDFISLAGISVRNGDANEQSNNAVAAADVVDAAASNLNDKKPQILSNILLTSPKLAHTTTNITDKANAINGCNNLETDFQIANNQQSTSDVNSMDFDEPVSGPQQLDSKKQISKTNACNNNDYLDYFMNLAKQQQLKLDESESNEAHDDGNSSMGSLNFQVPNVSDDFFFDLNTCAEANDKKMDDSYEL